MPEGSAESGDTFARKSEPLFVPRCSRKKKGKKGKKKFKRNSGPRADCQNRTDEPADTRRAPDVLECRRGSHAGRDYEAVTRPRKKIYGMIVHRRHNVRTPIGEKDRGRRGISSGIPGIPPKSVAYASSPSDGGKKEGWRRVLMTVARRWSIARWMGNC